MRRYILASVAAAALLATHGRAEAQLPVIDATSIAQDVKNFAQQIAQMKQDYDMYVGIFQNLLRSIDPNSVAQELISAANPMPQVGQIGSMITGGSNFGSLSGLTNQFLQSNTYYRPQSTGSGDFVANLLQRNGNTLSTVQAMAQQSLTSLQTHIAGLNDIQSQLSSVKSSADLAALQGRLQAEQANLTAQGVQAQSIANIAAAQQQQYDLQMLQKQRQDADELLSSAGGGRASTSDTTGGAPVTDTTILPATYSNIGAGG